MTRIRIRQSIRASAGQLWAAWTECSRLSCWQADEASGKVAPGTTLVLRWPTLGIRVDLEVLEASPPRRLVLRAGQTVVDVDLEPASVVLTQTGMASQDEAAGVASSWRVTLAILGHYLEEHDGACRSVSWLVRPVRTTAQSAHVFFTNAAALGSWLMRDCSDLGTAGAPFQGELAWGEAISGKVLANTPGRDVALSWQQQGNSVLSLRTVPSPLSDTERLLMVHWSRWQPTDAPDRTVARLEMAFDRLVRNLGHPLRSWRAGPARPGLSERPGSSERPSSSRSRPDRGR